MENKLLIGSHLDLTRPEYLLGTVKTAIAYGETTFMCYTGAPQNSFRVPVQQFQIKEAHALMRQSGLNQADIVVHAPYIINLANPINEDLYQASKRLLSVEMQRVQAMGFKILVLHPGSHVKAGADLGIQRLVAALNDIFEQDDSDVVIALETMAGKGSEIGSLGEIKTIIDGVQKKHRIGVCLDTCHLSDFGYDLSDIDPFVDEIDRTIGLGNVRVIHVNDSKNERGSHKDRHENIGFGYLGFSTLSAIVHHPAFAFIPKILETPYVNEKAPYRDEIMMLRNNIFNPQLKKDLL